jgi:hypothetical protein
MNSILSSIISRKYPQKIWINELSSIFEDFNILKSVDNIYDVPGGVGFVANGLSKKYIKNYCVYDIDDNKLDVGRKYFHSKTIEFENHNIYSVKLKKNSLWLLINSFYLLKGLEIFIASNYKNMPYIIGLFPYVNTENYQHFKTKIDRDLNSNEMTKSETISFFHDNRYELIYEKDTTYFNYLKYSQLSIIKYLCSMLFSCLESCFSFNGKLYWIGVFKRAN